MSHASGEFGKGSDSKASAVQQSQQNNSNYAMIALFSILVVISIWALFSAFESPKKMEESKKKLESVTSASVSNRKIIAPDFSKTGDGPEGESIRRGKALLENTHALLPKYVGAKINCTSCHLASGTTPQAGPWVGIVTKFPQYRSRSGKMDTLPDRVNDCFERSLNGKRLPLESRQMTDIITYMTWLSNGYEVGAKIEGSGMPKLKIQRAPDMGNGKIVYQAKCASCHQANGNGSYDAIGKKIIFPPLWGSDSYNIGAGMARLHTAAGFVKHNMPLGQGGSLTDDEAWDVAAYFTQMKRPDFGSKAKDWPKGEKPEDARY
ncbi:MAG: c-type cytochrome [Deltaproteobacteria bacterium]|nr:c-type cytochrome [Deltaproteobacteria bacterium]